MTVRLDPHQVAGLHQQLVNTLEQIDCALDRGDRRAFRIWAGKYRHITVRLAAALMALAATEPA